MNWIESISFFWIFWIRFQAETRVLLKSEVDKDRITVISKMLLSIKNKRLREIITTLPSSSFAVNDPTVTSVYPSSDKCDRAKSTVRQKNKADTPQGHVKQSECDRLYQILWTHLHSSPQQK